MTITFAPAFEEADVTGFAIEHADGERWDSYEYATHAEAVGGLLEHGLRCEVEDCLAYGGSIATLLAVEPPSLNVSNINGVMLAGLLGIPGSVAEFGATLPAAEFRDRVVTALLLADRDKGVAAVETVSGGGLQWIDCGRPAGYQQDKLAQLQQVADWAIEHGRTVGIG